jgi:hypothetical protein
MFWGMLKFTSVATPEISIWEEWIMRKSMTAVLVLCLLLSAATAGAQSWKEAMRYEIKGGLVSTYLTSHDYQDTGVSWGWTAGGGLFLPFFTQAFGIQAEALYVHREISIQTVPTGATGPIDEWNVTANYVEIPLMAHLAFSNSPDVRAYLLGGFSTAINTSANIKGGPDNIDEDSEVADVEWRPLFGIGLRASSFLLEVRFSAGTRTLGDTESDDPSESIEAKVNNSVFLMGFSF